MVREQRSERDGARRGAGGGRLHMAHVGRLSPGAWAHEWQRMCGHAPPSRSSGSFQACGAQQSTLQGKERAEGRERAGSARLFAQRAGSLAVDS